MKARYSPFASQTAVLRAVAIDSLSHRPEPHSPKMFDGEGLSMPQMLFVRRMFAQI
jgi:hypothetical protein